MPAPRSFCPPGYDSRITAITDLIRWGPSIFTHSEFLLLLYYAERTLVYGKQADVTSLRQITRGIYSSRKQEWIRGPAGVSATAIKNANKSLAVRGFLVCRSALPGEDRYRPEYGNEATEYAINWIDLRAEFAKRKSAPLGPAVTKPLGRRVTKPLGRQVPNNRGDSSSEEKVHRGSTSGVRDDSRARKHSAEPAIPGKDQKNSESAGDDDAKPAIPFTSPKAELAYLIEQRGGLLSEFEWLRISEQLELREINLAKFVAFLRPHLLNPKTENPLGMVKSKLKRYASMTRPALTHADLQAPEAASGTTEKCPTCKADKGTGTLLVGDRLVACECATEEWRAKVERQEQERLQRAQKGRGS